MFAVLHQELKRIKLKFGREYKMVLLMSFPQITAHFFTKEKKEKMLKVKMHLLAKYLMGVRV
jgi:hypothetical protein